MFKFTVSVVIPSFNGEARLPVVISSLSSQVLKPNEIIVVIDGSTDQSVDVMINLVRQYPLLPEAVHKDLVIGQRRWQPVATKRRQCRPVSLEIMVI